MKLSRIASTLFVLLASTAARAADNASHWADGQSTTTPIKHVIVVIGENVSFDTLFGAYVAPKGRSVFNLLSEGIINADGTPGPRYGNAVQRLGSDRRGLYNVEPLRLARYEKLPQPTLTGVFNPQTLQPYGAIPDPRFATLTANGPFQITKFLNYGDPSSATGDPVLRFFQMWQQTGGSNERLDMYTWVATTTGIGGDNPRVTPDDTGQGGELMGFFNMATGDAPFFNQLAQNYALSDNYHQAILGGTGANFFAIATGDAAPYKLDGKPATPPANQIENPNPTPRTDNFYIQDGYSGGSYVNCADASQPCVAAILIELREKGRKPNCEQGTYYLVNNYDPPFTIDAIAFSQTQPLLYNNIGDPHNASANVVGGPLKNNLQGLDSFFNDVSGGRLPAVSFVVPKNLDSGHPGYSVPGKYELFVKNLLEKVQANPMLWQDTAILITTDEGGGDFDTGYIQNLDFFGDGPRIPLLVVSPDAKKGHVDHVYHDHASILKFIERN